MVSAAAPVTLAIALATCSVLGSTASCIACSFFLKRTVRSKAAMIAVLHACTTLERTRTQAFAGCFVEYETARCLYQRANSDALLNLKVRLDSVEAR